MKRRKFIQNASLSSLALVSSSSLIACENKNTDSNDAIVGDLPVPTLPLVVATWNVPNATAAAWKALEEGKSALDAVEAGCRVEEADVKNQSVGKGGLPDRDGNVTLDACIMNKDGDYGAVVYLKDIVHPISVARKVMEKTPHVLMAGEGARQFAISEGHPMENLLTKSSKKAWEEWQKTSEYKPVINIENHDTIGMLAIDKNGDLAGACTTSGLAYKMAGRVGDSPIIGSGLFVDNEIGAATATGLGEEVLKTVGSFLIVELMRQGKSPQAACEEAIRRIVTKNKNHKDFQVGYIAVNKKGEVGAYSIHEWFSFMRYQDSKNENIKSEFFLKTQ